MDDYRSPTSTVIVGEWEIATPPRWRVRSSRLEPMDVATVELDNASGTAPAIAPGDVVEIWQGWRESGQVQVFGGVVDGVEPGASVRLECADLGRRLSTQEIVRSWVDVTPQEVVEQIAEALGVDAVVELRDLPRRHRCVLPRQSGLDAIRSVLRVWGASERDVWCSPDGRLYVGPWEQSPRHTTSPRLRLERGEEILDLRVRDHRSGWCQTLSIPELQHSMVVELVDEEFLGEPVIARLETITYEQWPFARTELEWTRLS